MLALEEAWEWVGPVDMLATFVPRRGSFRAHPLPWMRLQARLLGIEHRTLPVDPPYREGYEMALVQLRRMGISTIITGDIAPVEGRENWIRAQAKAAGLHAVLPLWGRARDEIFAALDRRQIHAVISYVRDPTLGPTWVGRRLDHRVCGALLQRQGTTGSDACGEQGEYHTMVVDAPRFRTPLTLPSGPPVFDGAGWHLPWCDAMPEGTTPADRQG